MHITTKGGSSTQKKYATSMAEFCGEKLLGTRLFPKVSVEIQFVKNLLKKEEIYGDAEWLDFERRPKEFTIRVDGSQPLRRMLETVAHEMVHVKQYAKDELHEYVQKKGHRYKGEYYKDGIDYWDEPWEIEAHGREIGLFVRWAEKHKLGKRKWTQIDA
jgi:hypothetical protein|tara:strand:- start:15983 stop:16459 length:477 start_codon:yes stop_codon:yes gene_type:complete